jgi:hypothetical protein
MAQYWMPITTFSRLALFANGIFGAMALEDTDIHAFIATLRPPTAGMRRFASAWTAVSGASSVLAPRRLWCLDHGTTGGDNSKALVESYLLSFRSSTSSNGVPPLVVRLVKPIFEELVGCVLSFRGRATQGASVDAAWAALL